jgi:hypothetical protein
MNSLYRLAAMAGYLVCAVLALYPGGLVGGALAAQLSGHPRVAFAVLLVMGLGVLVLGAFVEDRLLWRGVFTRAAGTPRPAGGDPSRLLRSAAPSPLSLGFGLGLLSHLA